MSQDDEDEMNDQQVFDTTKSTVEYHRSKDLTRVTILVKDPGGINEMRLYLLLAIEVENLEKRLGISEAHKLLQ